MGVQSVLLEYPMRDLCAIAMPLLGASQASGNLLTMESWLSFHLIVA
jgi:hypothetical protein